MVELCAIGQHLKESTRSWVELLKTDAYFITWNHFVENYEWL
jgi:hypothetical protein